MEYSCSKYGKLSQHPSIYYKHHYGNDVIIAANLVLSRG